MSKAVFLDRTIKKKRDMITMAVKIRLTRMGSKKNLSTVLTLQIHVHHVMVVLSKQLEHITHL